MIASVGGAMQVQRMLIDFSVENYRSIADKQTLSMVASKHRSDAEGQAAVQCAGFKHELLTSAVIYGANASGKSNILRALNEFRCLVGNSAVDEHNGSEPHLLDPKLAKAPTRFEASFVLDGVRYQYGFSIDSERVHEEWLLAYPRRTAQVWFDRKWNGTKHEVQFSSHLKGEKTRIHAMTRANSLFLSVAVKFNQTQLEPIFNWITTDLCVRQAKFISSLATALQVEAGGDSAELVKRFLGVADLGIERVLVHKHNKLPTATENDNLRAGSMLPVRQSEHKTNEGEFLEIQTEHTRTNGKKILFDMLYSESDGTSRYFSLIAPLVSALRSGGIFAVDELDDSLHPLLVREIVRAFHDPSVNKNKAQLIFNTHDTTLLDPALFRRDQIWFTQKDSSGKTKLYPLIEFSPRKNEALQKGYLEGRYGAIPFLGHFAFEDTTKTAK